MVCDWGIDMSDGPGTLLPHLARAKAVAQAARLRVMWHLQQGRAADAREEWLATLALARNASRDGTLISTLVQMAIEAINCNTLAENFGRFPVATLTQLAAAMDAGPARGTVAACVSNEKSFFRDWTLRQIERLRRQYPANDAQVIQAIHELLVPTDPEGNNTNLWTRLVTASGGTSEGVIRLMREQEPFNRQLAEVLTLPYAQAEPRLQDLSAQIEASTNPLVQESYPAVLKARRREVKMEVWRAMVRAAVAYKVEGEAGLKQVMDPCAMGPFAFRRFVFEGVDRGFELRSAFEGSGFPETLIFVEKEGPAFRVDGPFVGQAVGKK